MKTISFALTLLASVASCSFAPSHPRNPAVPASENFSTAIIEASFDQLIDHTNASSGTFKQRYWYSTEYWNGTGSPVIIFNPGEQAAAGFGGYLEIDTLTGQYIEAVGGAGIVLEHRYWGTSSPFTDLTTENLRYHTVAQAVQDMTYFANNVELPFDKSGNSNADKAPWVLVGGSYSGALAAWTATTAPGTFWAYHASSAPVEAIEDYWGYFYPIQQGMPANCSNDISRVISYVDGVLTNGSSSDKLSLKESFGLGNVEHDSDFASVLVYPLDFWQESIASFLPFCDYLEGVSAGGKIPGADGVGLDAAFVNYASYINSSYAQAGYNFDSYDKTNSEYTNTTLDPTGGAGRQWQWLLCNEALGYWQTGAPSNQTTLVSRFVTADYYQQRCNYYFPDAQFALTEERHNDIFGGWNLTTTQRLLFANGEFDPWRSAGVSSAFRPGGPLKSTTEVPVFIVPNGIHVQDLAFADATPAILDIRKQELARMVSWIEEYYSSSSVTTSSARTSSISTSTSLSALQSTTTTHSATTTPTTLSSTQIPHTYTVTDVVSFFTTVDCESTAASPQPTKIARSYQA